MVVQAGTALARIVIITPRRRLELALPEHLPIASMLHVILRHAEDDPAAAATGDWVLRRLDGTCLDMAKTLASQNVKDGEVLHLTEAAAVWPEPDFDDIVEVIADTSRKQGILWTSNATRLTGLVVSGIALGAGLGVVAMSGKPWWLGGSAAVATAVILLLLGIALSRALADSVAGAVVSGLGLPYAFLGGALLIGGIDSITEMGAPHLLAGSASLLLVAVLAYLGVGDATRAAVAGIWTALYGLVGAVLAIAGLRAVESAAAVISITTLLLPALPLLAIRLVRMPLPSVPRTPEDLVDTERAPDFGVVSRATARADELLTGSIFGFTVVSVACLALLAVDGSVASLVLIGIVGGANMLRARLLLTVRHRVPLLGCGLAGLVTLPLLAAVAAPAAIRVAVLLVVCVCVAGAVIAAGLTYSSRPPSPRLGRLGDVLDVILQLAVIPVACGVLGLYGFMRALSG